jgi:hypothetical protein
MIIDEPQHQNISKALTTQKKKSTRKKERKLMIEESEITLEKKNKM